MIKLELTTLEYRELETALKLSLEFMSEGDEFNLDAVDDIVDYLKNALEIINVTT